MRYALATWFVAVAVTAFAQPSPSPYAGMESRAIATMPAERLEGLRRGAGLGYALPAELNGHPGPMHVLELANELGLSPAQRARTEDIMGRMRAAAISQGEALITAEAHLHRMFAMGHATPERVAQASENAARVEGRLRVIHLTAHLDMMEVLTPQQVATYVRLRGYSGPGGPAHGHAGPHRH